MASLLGKRTAMPVVEVQHGVLLRPNHVYVIPPNTYITIRDGGVFHEPPVKQHGVSLPIDQFFRSLAEARGEPAIGIVLSGTGSDGATGLKEIKGAGAITCRIHVPLPTNSQGSALMMTASRSSRSQIRACANRWR
jgi:two-component system CheB/CheR fusion protein